MTFFHGSELLSTSHSLPLPPSGAPIITLCSNPAFQLLSGNLPADLIGTVFDLRAVRTGDTLDLGGGESAMLTWHIHTTSKDRLYVHEWT